MKISIGRLKEIVMEEVARATKKEVSKDDLYLAELFDTGAVGHGQGLTPAAMKELCERTHGKGMWVDTPEEGEAGGYCKKPIEESLNIELVDDE